MKLALIFVVSLLLLLGLSSSAPSTCIGGCHLKSRKGKTRIGFARRSQLLKDQFHWWPPKSPKLSPPYIPLTQPRYGPPLGRPLGLPFGLPFGPAIGLPFGPPQLPTSSIPSPALPPALPFPFPQRSPPGFLPPT